MLEDVNRMKPPDDKGQLVTPASVTFGIIIGALVGFALHFKHFLNNSFVSANPFIHGLFEIGGSALVGAILLPLTTAALKWAAKTIQKR